MRLSLATICFSLSFSENEPQMENRTWTSIHQFNSIAFYLLYFLWYINDYIMQQATSIHYSLENMFGQSFHQDSTPNPISFAWLFVSNIHIIWLIHIYGLKPAQTPYTCCSHQPATEFTQCISTLFPSLFFTLFVRWSLCLITCDYLLAHSVIQTSSK